MASKTLEQVVAENKGKMKYVRLGNSGLKVSRFTIGCMSYGTPDWDFFTGQRATWVLNEEQALPVIKAAYDVGCNSFDTANCYSNGISEQVLGKAVREFMNRDEVVITTKISALVTPTLNEATLGMSADQLGNLHYVNCQGLSRKAIFSQVDRSLERLGLDYIDILQIHRMDPDTDVKEIMRALHDVVQTGKVRYLSASSMWAWQIVEANLVARQHGWTEFISMQNYYSAAYREEEREMFPALKRLGVASTPWMPLDAGKLARPISEKTKLARAHLHLDEPKGDIAVNQAVEKVAKKLGVPMAQVALAWIYHKEPVVASPVIGITRPQSLEDACQAMHLKLSDEDVKEISDAYETKPVFGHA